MGNNPNQFIQCGFSEKDIKKQVQTTKEYAIKYQRSDDYDQKLMSGNSSNDIQSITTTNQNNRSKSEFFIPQHENLIKVSRKPLSNFIRVPQTYFYVEDDKGKCLDQIIQSRYHTSMHFPQPQMISLLESLVYSLAYLSKKKIPHHDFYPTNIYYGQGKFRLQNPCIIPGSGYSLTQQRKRFSFLSPQLILQVLNDTQQDHISVQVMDKSDVFAIGMILLQFCTLQPSSQCYDAQTYNIIDSVVHQRVNKCSNIYNPQLSQCIDLMLQYQVKKRIPPLQLSYAVHSTISNIKIPPNQIPNTGRMSMSSKLPTQKLQSVQLPPNQIPNQQLSRIQLPPHHLSPHQIPVHQLSSHQLPTHQLPPNIVQTRLPTGQIINGLPPGFVQVNPNVHLPQQAMQNHYSVQQKNLNNLPQEQNELKLNPFQQIQEQNYIQSQKKIEKSEPTKTQHTKNDNEKQTLQERVQRILEQSRTIK